MTTRDTATVDVNETNQVKICFAIRQHAERISSALEVVTASATAAGIVELATDAETLAGTDTVRAVTPANIAALRTASFKVGSFTRDLTALDASVAYTGVGFKPKAVIFLAGVTTGSALGSVGFSNAVTNGGFLFDFTTPQAIINANAAAVGTNVSNFQAFTVTSFDTDGFTVSWVKISSPTGTGTIYYLATR